MSTSSRHRWVDIATRVARPAVVVALCAAVLVGATRAPDRIEVPLAPGDSVPSTTPARIAVTSASFTCPGPHTEGLTAVPAVEGTTTVLAGSPPAAALTAALAGVTVSDDEGRLDMVTLPREQPISQTVTASGVTAGAVSGARSAYLNAVGARAPGLAVAQTWLGVTGDDRGFSAAPCTASAADQWVVAGGSEVSRRERLVVSNPGGNPVTIDVTVHGTSGALPSLSGEDLTVPARGRIVLSVDALNPQEGSPVIRVRASGGVVGVAVHDSLIEAAVGQGADDAVPGARSSETQVIPFVPGATPALLRVGVTGDSAATVRIRYLTATGSVPLGASDSTRIGAESTLDLALSDAPTDAFGVVVTSDEAIVAAVQSRVVGTNETSGDLAWSSSAPGLEQLTGLPLTDDPRGATAASLGLAALDEGQVDVIRVSPSGTTSTARVSLPADSLRVLDVTGSSAVWVVPQQGRVHAAVRIGSPEAAAFFAVLALHPSTLAVTQEPVRNLTR